MRLMFGEFDISKNKISNFKKILLLKNFYKSKKFIFFLKKINYLYNIYTFLSRISKNYQKNKKSHPEQSIINCYDYFDIFYYVKDFMYNNEKVFESYLFENIGIKYLYDITLHLNKSYILSFYFYKIIIMRKKISLGTMLINFFLKKSYNIYNTKYFDSLMMFIKYSNLWYLNIFKNTFSKCHILKISNYFTTKKALSSISKELIKNLYSENLNIFDNNYVFNDYILELDYTQKKYFFCFFILFYYENFKKLVKIIKIFVHYEGLNWVKAELYQLFARFTLKANFFNILSILIKIFEINKIIVMLPLIKNNIKKNYMVTELKISFSIYIKKYIFGVTRGRPQSIYNIILKKIFMFLNKMTTIGIHFENLFTLLKFEIKKKINTKSLIFLFWAEVLKFFVKSTTFSIVNKLLISGLKFFSSFKIIMLILLKKLIMFFLKEKNFRKLKVLLADLIVCFFCNSKNKKGTGLKLISNLIISDCYYSYYLINICTILNSNFIVCKVFEKLLNKHKSNYIFLHEYTKYLKNNDLLYKSFLTRYNLISHIKNQDKKIFWFNILSDFSIKKEIDVDKDFYVLEKGIFQNNFFNKELLFIIFFLLIIKSNTFNKLFLLTKKFFAYKILKLNFNYLFYILKTIGKYYGINQLVEFLRYIWLNFINIRFKKRDFIKMCFLLIFINEFLGNYHISRKILYSIYNISRTFKSVNIQKIYKNFEILHGNEESFRDYLLEKNNK